MNDFYALIIARQYDAELRDGAERNRIAKAAREARRARQREDAPGSTSEKVHRPSEQIHHVLRAFFKRRTGDRRQTVDTISDTIGDTGNGRVDNM